MERAVKSFKRILFSVTLLACSLLAADQAERSVVLRADPEYPLIAARMNLHGTVKLRIWIAPDGTVRRLEYIGGHPLLADAALKAVKAWKYQSAPKETAQVVAVKF
jgi:TonB family protein